MYILDKVLWQPMNSQRLRHLFFCRESKKERSLLEQPDNKEVDREEGDEGAHARQESAALESAGAALNRGE